MERKEQIIQNYNFTKNLEAKRITEFSQGKMYKAGMLSVSAKNFKLAKFEVLLNKNYIESKYNFFKGVKCDIVYRRHYTTFCPKLKGTFYSALLSDNKEMKQAVLAENLLPPNRDFDPDSDKPILDYPVMNKLDTFYQYDRGLQAALAGNNEKLEACVNRLFYLQKQSDIDYKDLVKIEAIFLEAILDGSSKVVNEALHFIYDNRKGFDYGQAPLYDDLYSHDLTGMAKLAVIRGIDVDLDVPQVPREFLEIKPLEKYESPEWLDVLFYEGRDAYEEKYVKPNQQNNDDKKKGNNGGFLGKWFK